MANFFQNTINSAREKFDRGYKTFIKPVVQARQDFSANLKPGGFVGFKGQTAQRVQPYAQTGQKIVQQTVQNAGNMMNQGSKLIKTVGQKLNNPYNLPQQQLDATTLPQQKIVGAVGGSLLRTGRDFLTGTADTIRSTVDQKRSFVDPYKKMMSSGVKIATTPLAVANPGQTIGLGGLSGVLNAGLGDKTKDNRFETGLAEGVTSAGAYKAIGMFTNPVIDKVAGKLMESKTVLKALSRVPEGKKQAFVKFLAERASVGALNVPEGVIMQGTVRPDTAYTVQDALLDFTAGFAGGKSAVSQVGAKQSMEEIVRSIQKKDKNFRIIHPEDRQRMLDLVNYSANPKIKDGSDLQLELDASRIAERYGIKMGSDIKSIAQQFKKTLDSVDTNQHIYRSMQDNYAPNMGIVDNSKPMNESVEPIKTETQNFTPLKIKPEGEQKPFDADAYAAKMSKQQVEAGNVGKPEGLKAKVKGVYDKFKSALIDFTAPIEDTLAKAQKEGKFEVMPSQNIRYQIDRVLRSDPLATQFAKDNGLEEVIKNTDDYTGMNQYLIAKRNIELSQKSPDIATGRDVEQDRQYVAAKQEVFEPLAAKIRDYTKRLLDYKVQTGLVSEELANALRAEYPDYVPLNRVFDFLEEQSSALKMKGGKSKGVASIGTQKVLQRLKGSEREIQNPLESLLEATGTAFRQGEINKAARMLANYRYLPGNPFQLRELAQGETVGTKATISYFENGVKKTYETTPEIAAAAKNLNKEQMNIVTKIFQIPTRLLQMGATGLNVPFVLSNLVKDQFSSAIVSKKSLATSLANPLNFVRAMFSVLKKDEVYDDWVRSGAGGTSFDLTREGKKLTVDSIRANRSKAEKFKYIVRNPKELIRAIEDVIGTTEELTRVQQYKGMYDQLIKEGRTVEDAKILAGEAARMNTANFARRGELGSTLNAVVPFFNAGIQGSRSFVRQLQSDPKGTSTKLAIGLFLPVTAATLYNVSDPERKKAYDELQEYEKEGYIILITGTTPDESGRYPSIKIPLPPGIGGLAGVVRRQIEGVNQLNPEGLYTVSKELIGSVSPVNPLDAKQTFNSIIPQALKPGIEDLTNTNLFTGQKIVPEYMKNLPAEEQVRDDTSATARGIGKLTGKSPMVVENYVKTGLGGLGDQLLNASDTALVGAGMAPKEQIGGRSIPEQIKNRFLSSKGGKGVSEIYDEIDKTSAETTSRNTKIKQALISGKYEEANLLMKDMTQQQKSAVVNAAQDMMLKEQMSQVEKALFSMSKANREAFIKEHPEYAEAAQKVESMEATQFKIPGFKSKKVRTKKGKKSKRLKARKGKKSKLSKRVKIKKLKFA